MKVLGKILVFPSTTLKQDGTSFKTFRGSLNKNKGTKDSPIFVNMSIDVRFKKDNFTDEQLNKFKDDECYLIDVTDGLLSFDNWEKDGVNYYKPFILVVSASILEHKTYNKSNNTKASEKAHNRSKTSQKAQATNSDDLPF